MFDAKRPGISVGLGSLGVVVLLAISVRADAAWRDQLEAIIPPVKSERALAANVDCGIRLAEPAASSTDTFPVRVVLAVDDAWAGGGNDAAVEDAFALVRDVAAVFDPFGIQLRVVRFETWPSHGNDASASELLGQVQGLVPLVDEDIVLALTGRQIDGADGKATIGGGYALVGQHPGHPERDIWVASHEIGHVFGAEHTVGTSARLDVMSPKGFGPDVYWSSCHEELLRVNAGRFEQGAGPLE